MLAAPGQPFDSEEHLFEIKWDGTRAVCYLDGPGAYRLMNRRKIDIAGRFPELSVLNELPPGSVLDGEIVVLNEGKPDFQALQSREHAGNAMNIRFMSRQAPATYILFDVLFEGYQSVMEQPCQVRRALLRDL